MKKGILIPAFVVAMAVAATAGFLVGRNAADTVSTEVKPSVTPKSGAEGRRVYENGRLTNRLIDCENFSASDIAIHAGLKQTLNTYIRTATHQGSVSNVSVYYRDLNNGPWIGIDEDEPYEPASLLKVAAMMAAYKYSESHPGFLDKKVKLTPNSLGDFTPNIADETIQIGSSYTIRDLVAKMIVNSDNWAMNLVLDELEKVSGNLTVWSDLGIKPPEISDPLDFMSPKQYASFFRVLYNASYLSQENSETALGLLSQTHDGLIRVAIPEGIAVASKFGERGHPESPDRQLHNCAIVYDGNKPYLLSVMTRGTDFVKQAEVIEEISRMVYEGR